MMVRQEETTPIGDFFHDSGMMKVFEDIKDTVDEFEVDTELLESRCDQLISLTKSLKAKIKGVEKAWHTMSLQEE